MKFKIRWREEVVQNWELEVEVEDAEAAKAIFEEGNHITGEEEMIDEDWIDSEFIEVEKMEEN